MSSKDKYQTLGHSEDVPRHKDILKMSYLSNTPKSLELSTINIDLYYKIFPVNDNRNIIIPKEINFKHFSESTHIRQVNYRINVQSSVQFFLVLGNMSTIRKI